MSFKYENHLFVGFLNQTLGEYQAQFERIEALKDPFKTQDV